MNTDALECKRKAQELVTFRNPPFNRNGRRRGYIESSQDQNNVGKSSQNANQLILDLNMSAIQTPEECDHSTSKKVLNDAPGCLPNYEAISAPSTFVWGQHDDGITITVSLSTIDNVYNEISKWQKNTFLVLYGK